MTTLPDTSESQAGTRDWPHAPPHRLGGAGVYFVTARTLHRRAHFHTPARLTVVRDLLLSTALKYHWRMEAWAVLNNHYHFVAHSTGGNASAASLRLWLKDLHAAVSRALNKEDNTPGRTLWHNYRETHLTFQRSYLARLHYTHRNPQHHHLVPDATAYEWCSAAVFEKACTGAWAKTIASFACDQIAKEDDDEA